MKFPLLLFYLLMGCAASAQHSGPAFKINLVTDKNIYTPNEQIWFSAFLSNSNPSAESAAEILTLALYDPVTRNIAYIKKFLIEGSVSTGSILLPDSMKAGNYTLLVYPNLTDQTGRPAGVAYKPVKIFYKAGEKSFTTHLQVIDSLTNASQVAIQHTMIPATYQAFFKDVEATFFVGRKKGPKTSIDQAGKATILIDRKEIKTDADYLLSRTVYNGDTVENRIALPGIPPASIYSLRLYPETGVLTAGFINRIFWEKNDAAGSHRQVASLLDGDTVIDSFAVQGNNGNFSFIPTAEHSYKIRVTGKGGAAEIYDLPPVRNSGLQIQLAKRVIKDTLLLNIRAEKPKNIHLLIVDAHGTPWVYPIKINKSTQIAMGLNELPRGTSQLLVYDEDRSILAKSYFFAHHQAAGTVNIQANKQVYKPREKVILTCDIKGGSHQPLQALASVSGVLLSRVDNSMFKNLETDFYFDAMATEPAYFGRKSIVNDVTDLENRLRLKSPGDLSLNHYMNAESPATPFSRPATILQAARNEKNIKRTVEFALIKDNGISLVATDADGKAALSVSELLVQDGRRIFAKAVDNKNSDVYALTIDSLTEMADRIAVPQYVFPPADPASASLLTDKGEKFAKMLESVVVESKRQKGAIGKTNACGDYVCQYNVLNCPAHPYPYKLPVKGTAYRIARGGSFIYQGCSYADNLHLNPRSLVYLPGQFPGMDSSMLQQEFPEYLTTIYWAPFTSLSGVKPNKLEFHASDQTGTYLLMVQGFFENGDPFYVEKTIRVEE